MKLDRVFISLLSILSLLPIKTASAETPAATPAATVEAAPLEVVQPEQARQGQAQRDLSKTEISESSSIEFNPPILDDRNRPVGRSEGAAGRGSCVMSDQPMPLTAIVPVTRETPEDGPEYESVFSLTAEPRPSFWFYVPYELSTTPIEFVLQDENDNTIYRNHLSSNSPDMGIVQVTLPATTPELQPDALYHWYFMAYCDLTSPSFVEGWIQRVSLDARLALALDNMPPRAQAAIYAENGLWQETVTLLGERYRQAPNNPMTAKDWTALLESANLTKIVEQSLIDCCSVPVVSPISP